MFLMFKKINYIGESVLFYLKILIYLLYIKRNCLVIKFDKVLVIIIYI